MTGTSGELAAAAVLADAAREMLIDAATALQDIGDLNGYDELSGLADDVSKAIIRIRTRKAAIDAGQLSNDNAQ